MKSFFRKHITFLFLAFLFALAPVASVRAQCPMCRATAESNLANGGSEGKGLNKGILYMLATPYLVVGLIGYLWWRNRRDGDTAEE
jgi:hypothetical protein